MSVQSVQDSGSVKGSHDLMDHVTVSRSGQSQVVTIEAYLAANSQYDSSESPYERLGHVLQQTDPSPIDVGIIKFVARQAELWNNNHPTAVAAGGSQVTQCSEGTTFVAASGPVTDNFCIDNVATYEVGGRYPTWQEAIDYCEAAGKFLLTYEQEKLGAESTNSEVVRNSGRWEWVLKSNGDDSQGQVGGFFGYVGYRSHYASFLPHFNPVTRHYGIAFRCGRFPSPQD